VVPILYGRQANWLGPVGLKRFRTAAVDRIRKIGKIAVRFVFA
jgi:hypothetical protein